MAEISIENAIARFNDREKYKGKKIKTVGELKKLLADFEDHIPLALGTYGFGWGVKVFASQHSYETESAVVYCGKKDPNLQGIRRLSEEVCVIEPST